VNTSYLVSALNILNESEIQFKMARNKRLHVELALIKLNFLQQALSLSMEDGQLVKKKLVDVHYPIKTKKIVPLSNIVVTKEATLEIESTVNIPVKKEKPKTTAIATQVPSTVTEPSPAKTTKTVASLPVDQNGNKKNLLAALQEKYGSQYQIEEVKESRSLDMETLQTVWNEYTAYLETTTKHSSAGTFKLAELQIEDPIHFTVTVPALVAQKFVEQERMNVMEKIWDRFQNRAIQFSILVAAGEKEDVPLHLRLNSKQKFERIAEQYPLVKELKDRLNLEVYF
jgi:DNA polymerase-3 subunit gamma/tau